MGLREVSIKQILYWYHILYWYWKVPRAHSKSYELVSMVRSRVEVEDILQARYAPRKGWRGE